MFAIYKRELSAYFHSFIGCLFIGVTLFFLGLYYTVYNLMYGYPYYSYAINAIIFLFLLTVPVLTMRILAEEKKSRTDQLILTAPVSVGGIVMGKFLALTTIFAIPTLISCIYPLVLTSFGTIPLGTAYISVLAFFLYGTSCIAIGLLVSALTESQVIAAVLTFGILFLGYMMSSICGLISQTGNLLTRTLGLFDMYTPFGELLNGTLNVDAVVYFLSLTVLALFLTVQVIQKRRYSVSVKHFSFSAYSTGMIALVAAVLVAVNVIVGELPGSLTAIDLTVEKLYSLTDQTEEFVKNMTEDVTIYVLVKEEEQDTTLGQTLDRYEELSEHITVEYVDPAVNPMFYTQYTDSSVTLNSMIVVSDKRSRVINANDIYESTIDYNTYQSTVTGYDGEGQITSALDYVTSDNMPKLYLTEGHEETALSARFTEALEKQNVTYETINLMNHETVPEDASGLFINAPMADFNADDKEKVLDYLKKGGKVVLVTAYTEAETPNLDEILSFMGLSVADGILIEENKDHYYQLPYYLLPDMIYSDYTEGIYGDYYLFAPMAQGILIADEDAEDMSYSTFLKTSEDGFAKSNLADAADLGREENDIAGPLAIGVEAVRSFETQVEEPGAQEGAADTGAEDGAGTTDATDAGEENGTVSSADAGVEDGTGEAADDTEEAADVVTTTEGTMIVLGCQQIFTDAADMMVSGANQMLFGNIAGALSDHEVSVSIPVKSYELSYLTVPQTDFLTIGLIVTVVLPVSCLAVGFVIWFRRRKR